MRPPLTSSLLGHDMLCSVPEHTHGHVGSAVVASVYEHRAR
jgi:hypothetical protein